MAVKRPTGRLIKIHRSYTVEEAARALGVAKGTVRRWLKQGLECLNDQRPALILGRDLKGFLETKRRPKQSCRPDECFCMSCKAPRRPAFDEVEFHPMTATGGNLRALCEACSTVMHKRVSTSGLEALKAILTVIEPQAETPIGEGAIACTNDHFEKELKNHA
ncbi:MAG: helix-turn-helix domain-containing protein [Parasphingorhabdus sp.]|uniref:helix-turn-helix domain-containing protein n=1 Tax=Alphaproteobacteria TaxID=28211 RepID=UPI003265C8DD